MKNIFLLLSFLLFGAMNAYGQRYLVLSEKAIQTNFGVFKPMTERGFPAVDEGIIQIRTGVKFKKEKFSFFPNISAFFSNDNNKLQDKFAKLKGYGLGFETQYHLLDWKSFRVCPSVEIGLEQYHLIYEETLTQNSPGSLFPQRKEKVEAFHFVNIGLYEDVALCLEKYYPIGKHEFGFGFELGYRFNQGQWKIIDESIKITNAIIHQNVFFFGLQRHLRRNR